MGWIRRTTIIGAALAATLLGAALPAHATGAQNDFQTGYGTFRVKAYHCSVYTTACDWRSETMLINNGGRIMDTITNVSRLEAHGVDVSVRISKNPEATLTMVSRSLGEVRWTRFTSNNVVTRGQMQPSGGTTYVSVNSCGSGDGPSSFGFVSEKCAYAGAF